MLECELAEIKHVRVALLEGASTARSMPASRISSPARLLPGCGPRYDDIPAGLPSRTVRAG